MNPTRNPRIHVQQRIQKKPVSPLRVAAYCVIVLAATWLTGFFGLHLMGFVMGLFPMPPFGSWWISNMALVSVLICSVTFLARAYLRLDFHNRGKYTTKEWDWALFFVMVVGMIAAIIAFSF